MSPLQNIPPWAIAIILCLLIATFTECTSNVATATLFLPVLASMVSHQKLNVEHSNDNRTVILAKTQTVGDNCICLDG